MLLSRLRLQKFELRELEALARRTSKPHDYGIYQVRVEVLRDQILATERAVAAAEETIPPEYPYAENHELSKRSAKPTYAEAAEYFDKAVAPAVDAGIEFGVKKHPERWYH